MANEVDYVHVYALLVTSENILLFPMGAREEGRGCARVVARRRLRVR